MQSEPVKLDPEFNREAEPIPPGMVVDAEIQRLVDEITRLREQLRDLKSGGTRSAADADSAVTELCNIIITALDSTAVIYEDSDARLDTLRDDFRNVAAGHNSVRRYIGEQLSAHARQAERADERTRFLGKLLQ